jgi:hypothetical protein
MPIVQYWDAGDPPDYVAELLATSRDRNPDMPYMLFDGARAEEFIGERFGAREVAAFRACALPSMRADYLRYCAVLALGGIYADVGYRCLQALQSLLVEKGERLLVRQQPGGFLLNGFFAFAEPGDPLLRLALEVATTNIELRACERVQMVTGPWIFSALGALHRLSSSGTHLTQDGDSGHEHLAEALRREALALAPTASGRRAVPAMVQPLLRAVDDPERVVSALAGVRVVTLAELAEGLREAERAVLRYKQNETYWINWQQKKRTIFR